MLGICCTPTQIQPALDAGFDFVELPANQLSGLDPNEFQDASIYSTNLFFPGGVRLFGPNPFDWPSYAVATIERAAHLGVRIMVIGSGGQRKSAESQTTREAEKKFVEIVATIQEIAQPYGVQIAPEALNHHETDVFTSATAIASALAARGIGYTFDTHHAQVEGEAGIDRIPAHVHVAGVNRLTPSEQDPVWDRHVRPLIHKGYRGAISLECLDVAFNQTLKEAQETIRRLLDCEGPA